MPYEIKAKFYADKDNFGESFVLQSNNLGTDLKLEVGTHVLITPIEICKECIGTGWHGTLEHCSSCKGLGYFPSLHVSKRE